jgi:competence protein ComEA
LKSSVKNYLAITKTEWNSLVILVLLIMVVLAAPYVYRLFHKDRVLNLKGFDNAIAQLKQAGVTGKNLEEGEETETNQQGPVKLFAFDPNNLAVTQWQKLGLSVRQIKGIKNYEAKGGRFYTKADVKKMYTITPQDYQRLAPYIQLPQGSGSMVIKALKRVDLNTADSASLTQLKGIGPAFARRIVQYRKRLGGFYSKQQLKEVFGMDDMRYADVQGQFTLKPGGIKRMNVNKVEFEDLKNFPYLSYKQMSALVQYRKQHGDYESFEELHNVAILDDVVLKKIKPNIMVK